MATIATKSTTTRCWIGREHSDGRVGGRAFKAFLYLRGRYSEENTKSKQRISYTMVNAGEDQSEKGL